MLVLSSCIFLVITLKYLIKYITKLTLKNLQKYYEIFEDVGCIHQIPTLFSAPQSFWKRNRRIIRKKHTAVTFWYWRHVIPAHSFRHVAHSTHRGTRSAINGTTNPKDTKSHCSLTPVESFPWSYLSHDYEEILDSHQTCLVKIKNLWLKHLLLLQIRPQTPVKGKIQEQNKKEGNKSSIWSWCGAVCCPFIPQELCNSRRTEPLHTFGGGHIFSNNSSTRLAWFT